MNYKASLIDRRGQRSANSVCLHSPGKTARRDSTRPLEKWQQQWNWTPAHKCPLWGWGHGRCVTIWFIICIFLCCPTESTYPFVDASSMLAELVWQHRPSHSLNECLKVTLKCTPSFILIWIGLLLRNPILLLFPLSTTYQLYVCSTNALFLEAPRANVPCQIYLRCVSFDLLPEYNWNRQKSQLRWSSVVSRYQQECNSSLKCFKLLLILNNQFLAVCLEKDKPYLCYYFSYHQHGSCFLLYIIWDFRS